MGRSLSDVTDRPILPRIPPGAVSRPRLDERLDAIVPGGVGLVVAPAGSGKSVLLGQWTQQPALRACHLRITAQDDDPVRFTRRLAAALTTVLPEVHERLEDLAAAGSAPGEAFIRALLVEVERVGRPVIIVLDDIHLLSNRAITADLGLLIEALPDCVRLVIGGRWDPAMRFGQVRLEGRLVEVRGSDLAFTVDEARRLVEAVAQRDITPDQTRALVARTDGWAVGLHLAGLLLQRATDVDDVIEQFTGSSQLVADYLAEEVIDEIEPGIRRFLLRTSILDWLDPDLCDAVTGDGNARQMLDALARRSLFLVPPDARGEQLRYHHLFADLLRYRLRSEAVDEPSLRLRAADWLLDHDHVAEAVEQLLAAGDTDGVLSVILEHGRDFFERQEAATLSRWLEAARSRDRSHPAALEVNLMAAHLAAHEVAAVGVSYRRLRLRDDLTPGEVAAAAALFACLGMDDLPTLEVHRAVAETRAILRADGEIVINVLGVGGRDTVEALAEIMAGIAMINDGNVADSERQFEATLTRPGAQYPAWKVNALGGLALSRALMGRCSEAESAARAAVDVAADHRISHHQSLAFARLALVQVALDRLDRETATRRLHESDTWVQAGGRNAILRIQRLLQVDTTALTSGPEAAWAELTGTPPGAFDSAFVSERRFIIEAELLLAQGKPRQAWRMVQAVVAPPALVIDIELACGNVSDARQVLDEWDAPAELRSKVDRALRRGAVLSSEGASADASSAFQEALDLAEPEGLRRPFLPVPAAMAYLRSHSERRAQAFARSIVELSPAPHSRGAAQDQLVEPLTERELEVLEYLPTRLSNTEMAAELYVSINTIKSHVRHIYLKLDAADRDDAVAKATAVGLLGPPARSWRRQSA